MVGAHRRTHQSMAHRADLHSMEHSTPQSEPPPVAEVLAVADTLAPVPDKPAPEEGIQASLAPWASQALWASLVPLVFQVP